MVNGLGRKLCWLKYDFDNSEVIRVDDEVDCIMVGVLMGDGNMLVEGYFFISFKYIMCVVFSCSYGWGFIKI